MTEEIKNKIIDILGKIKDTDEQNKILELIYEFRLLYKTNPQEFRKEFLDIKEYDDVIDMKMARHIIYPSEEWKEFLKIKENKNDKRM